MSPEMPEPAARVLRRGPRASSAPRSLLASGFVHATLVGAGILWGVLVPGGQRGEPRSFLAQLAPAAPAQQEEVETLELVEPVDRTEPELRESEVWSEAELPLEPAPLEVEPRARAFDWLATRPFEIGTLAVEANEEIGAETGRDGTAGPAAEPLPSEILSSERAPKVYEVAPRPPLVLEPAPRHVPAPEYPRLSRRLGEEGSVLCRLRLDAEGRVTAVVVVESSGHRRLDEAAVSALTAWVYEPRREDGRAVPAELLHRVTFRLGSG